MLPAKYTEADEHSIHSQALVESLDCACRVATPAFPITIHQSITACPTRQRHGIQYRSILTSPFGPGARLVPQTGFQKVVVHGVLLQRDSNGNLCGSELLLHEVSCNPSCQNLLYVNQPSWFLSNIPENRLTSIITFAFIDVDGSRLQQILRHPPSIFGSTTVAKKFISRPMIHQCSRCHELGHHGVQVQAKQKRPRLPTLWRTSRGTGSRPQVPQRPP